VKILLTKETVDTTEFYVKSVFVAQLENCTGVFTTYNVAEPADTLVLVLKPYQTFSVELPNGEPFQSMHCDLDLSFDIPGGGK
jgi:hypothetical protein